MISPTVAIADLRTRLLARPEVVTAYVFGSVATGKGTPRDVDLAIVFGDGIDRFHAALELQVMLETDTSIPVDVHDFDALPVDVQFRVVDEGHPIVERDPAARVRGEVRTMLAYYDFKPYLDLIRAGARQRLAAGESDG